MTTVMNEKLARAYIKTLDDKLIKKVRAVNKKITTEDLVEMIFQILPIRPTTQPPLRDALRLISSNQEAILDQQCQIQYLRRKAQLEDELTASFIKAIIKDKNKANACDSLSRTLKKQNSSFLNLPVPTLSRLNSSRIDIRESRLDDSLLDRSPICSISKKDDEQSNRYGACNTSRSKICGLREFSEELDLQEKQKIKALSKLRKLEKYVFEKQNINKDKSLTKFWNCGVSPEKLRYKQQNQNLKVIQSNLVTHLSLLEKYRQIPSIEGLVAREEALKKKQRALKQLGQMLSNKEMSLNKKHSDFLKRQKSQRVL